MSLCSFVPFRWLVLVVTDSEWPDMTYKHWDSMWLSGNLRHLLLKSPYTATHSLQGQGWLVTSIPPRVSTQPCQVLSCWTCFWINLVSVGPEAGHKRRHSACGDFCMQTPEPDLTQPWPQHLHSLDLGVKGKAQPVSWHFLCTFCELLKDRNWPFLLWFDFNTCFFLRVSFLFLAIC